MTNTSRCGRSLTAIALMGLTGLFATELAAVTFPDLYTVVVSPEPGAPDRRSAAVGLAMASLLERITGRTGAGADPELLAMVQNADSYVNSYGRLDQERVQVGFIGSAVERALAQANWPVWGAERPLTLIWMAIDTGSGERGLLSESFNVDEWSPEMATLMQSLETDLREVANARGLPVALPLLDLADLQELEFADVWGGFDDRLEIASQRYGADAYLTAQVRLGLFGTDIRWTLVQDGRRRIVLSTTVKEGLDWVAEQYAMQFSIVGGNQTMLITVSDVATLADYGRVMSYLESLSMLASVDVENFAGTELNLRVAARGDEDVLTRVLALGGVLAPPRSQPFPGNAASGLRFEVVRTRSQR
jgi:hypothetical protein